jgi:DNA ligase-1
LEEHHLPGASDSTLSPSRTHPSSLRLHLQLFDIPSRGEETFEQRYDFLQKTFGEGGTHATEQICVVHHEIAKNRQHVLDKLKEIESLGGEGLMLRKPASCVLIFFFMAVLW